MSMADDEWVAAMRSGDYHRAWDISASVLAARDPRARDDPSLPYHLRWVWSGGAFAGRHVLVRCYHGLGDTIQFARYLPLLRRHAASVTLEVQPRLACLFEDFPGVDRLIPFDPARPSPVSECDLEIMELAFALRTAPGLVPPPYLRSTPAVLPRGTVGLCHQAGGWDPQRSLDAANLLSACAAAPCLTLGCDALDLPILNPEGCPFDIAATAMLVAGLDLVVTVDTFIAHLAGAMGKDVWLLLKQEPDWRWPRHGRRTDWYPTMRLYAQAAAGVWAPVLAEVARDLAQRGRAGRHDRRSG
jgi:hypothetical protein